MRMSRGVLEICPGGVGINACPGGGGGGGGGGGFAGKNIRLSREGVIK